MWQGGHHAARSIENASYFDGLHNIRCHASEPKKIPRGGRNHEASHLKRRTKSANEHPCYLWAPTWYEKLRHDELESPKWHYKELGTDAWFFGLRRLDIWDQYLVLTSEFKMSILCHHRGGMPTLPCAASFNDRPSALPHAFEGVMLECCVIRSDEVINSKP
jgi:hypothetical protein